MKEPTSKHRSRDFKQPLGCRDRGTSSWSCLCNSFLPPVLEAEKELEGDGHPAGVTSASPSGPQTHTGTLGADRAGGVMKRRQPLDE